MIGGLAVATLLTLLVIPVVYSLLDRKIYEADRAAAAAPATEPETGPRTIPLIPGSPETAR